MTVLPDEEKPKFELPEGVEISALDQRPPTTYVLDELTKILGGPERIRLYLASTRKPERVANLARFKYFPMRWSDLTKKQAKAVESILPYKPDDFLRYGDCVICGSSLSAYQEREKYRQIMRERVGGKIANGDSAATLSQELGLPVSDQF